MMHAGLETLQAVAQHGPAQDLWAAAAVRETYQPASVLEHWLLLNPQARPDLQQEAIRVSLELQAVGVATTDAQGREALQLPADTRSAVLQSLGVPRARVALHAVPPAERTLAERGFAALLADVPLALDRSDRVQLGAMQVAAGWASAAGLAPGIEPEEMAQQLRQLDFLRLLGGADLHRFVGRGAILRWLNRLWLAKGPALRSALIEGPGGMGKSLAVCRFVADILDGSDPRTRPDAVFHLDFDRLSLQRARLATVLHDLVQQGRRWCQAGRADELAELAQHVMAGDSELEEVSQSSHSVEVSRSFMYVAQELLRLVSQGKLHPRLLVFIDSFEQVEGIDDTAASSPMRVVEMFVAAGAQVMSIHAARAFAWEQQREGAKLVRLRQFSVREADVYLVNEAARAGIQINAQIAARVRSAVGRSPLALRLAVGLLEDGGETFDASQWEAQALKSPELVQAALYDRLLRRIKSPELRKIAVPGLLVRRLTADVIVHVLAKPCQLDLTKTSPTSLMQAAKRECQLFVSDEGDTGALRHRQDVRTTMLANLERSTDPALVRSINENAVLYYSSKPDSPWFKTEELYHRLRLNQSPDQLDPRWSTEAGRALRTALPEFLPQARAYLRRRLGAATALGLPGSVARAATAAARLLTLNAAADPEAEFDEFRLVALHHLQSGAAMDNILDRSEIEEFRLLARHQLQSGAAVDNILDRWKTEQMRLDVPLGDVYAEALLRVGWHEPLLTSARELLTSNRAKTDPNVLCAVMSVAAALLEGRSALGEAQPFWLQALQAAEETAEPLTLIAKLVGSIRIRRKLNTGGALRERDFERALILVDEHTAGISERRVLAREVGAELSEALIDRRRHLPGLVRLITFVAEVNEAFPSALNNADRVEQISSRLFGITGNRQLRNLNSLMGKLIHGSGPDLERVVNTLREEVDWTLAQAAKGPATSAVLR